MSEVSPPPGDVIDVALDLRQATSHLLGVRLELEPQVASLRLMLPAWTPGSYLIRDYVRNLEGLEIEQGGQRLSPERVGVACWAVRLACRDRVRITYRILATELSVRTCHLDGDHGFLALAGVVLLIEGRRWSPQRLSLQIPSGWQAFVPLPADGDTSWWARDFDQLVDSPVEAGPHPSHRFSVATVPHRWVSWGGDLPVDDPRWLADVERVCLACCRLMAEPRPAADHYLFVLHLRERGFGGLEHDCASVLVYSRRSLATAAGRRRLLQLVAHEYLHQWNVRRLRPSELAPVDYGSPTIIPTLWFAEGVTSYYDQLLPLTAGLSSEAELLEDLGGDLSRYLLTPGRRQQSLRESSQEAWVKLYRQDAWSGDNQISYYLKGAVLALVLDLHLRRSGSCLALVLRKLWQRYGRHRRGYRESDLLRIFAAASADLESLLPAWLQGHEDPDLQSYLKDVGLRLQPQLSARADGGWQVESAEKGGLRLRRVARHGPAAQAGLQVGDELLAAEGVRLLDPEDLEPWLKLTDAGKPDHVHLELLFCRDGRIRRTSLRPAAAGIESWQLGVDPDADAQAAERRRQWLLLEPPP